MKTVKLVDSTFSHNAAIGLAGENAGVHPDNFQWDTSPGNADLKVWTDIRLHEAVNDPARIKIGMVIEPGVVAHRSQQTALDLRQHFDVILTHSKRLLNTGPPFSFYPFGGSWIADWDVYEKTKAVSLIVGAKINTDGQKLRHLAAQTLADKLDLFGRPYTDYLPSKAPMLRPYRYSVVIENCQEDYFFSEKLIDCLSQGTIPIYWGCPSIGEFFNLDGILRFQTLDELEAILQGATVYNYTVRLGAIRENLERARLYRCSEDWIWYNRAIEGLNL